MDSLFRNPVALLILAALFVPLERLRPIRQQDHFRPGWKTDVVHFFLTHLLQQLALMLAVGLIVALADPLMSPRLQALVGGQRAGAQFLEALLLVECIGYGMHRAFHAVPWLWRIHQVHHSSSTMDWLAAVRLHPLDQTITRAAQFLPLYLLGFSKETFGGVAVALGLWSLFLHANVRVRLGFLESLIATPAFHHWHHEASSGANFSGLFPWIDRLFGTLDLRPDWPVQYGAPAPPTESWAAHMLAPFQADQNRG